MKSRKTLFTVLAGTAVATAIGILLIPYRNSSRRKSIVEKARGYVGTAEESIKDSVVNVKKQIKKMGEAADGMVNEGGKQFKL